MLRPATNRDLAVVASWIATPRDCDFWAGSAISFPLQLDTLASEIALSPYTSFCLGATYPLAFGQLIDKGNGRAHLAKIIVSPSARRAGYGKALVEALTELAIERRFSILALNVQKTNDAAIALYTKLGFEMAERPITLGVAPGSYYMSRDLTARWSDQ